MKPTLTTAGWLPLLYGLLPVLRLTTTHGPCPADVPLGHLSWQSRAVFGVHRGKPVPVSFSFLHVRLFPFLPLDTYTSTSVCPVAKTRFEIVTRSRHQAFERSYFRQG